MGLFLILAVTIFGLTNAFEDKTVFQCLVDKNLTSIVSLIRDAKLESTLSNSAGGKFYIKSVRK